jgi:hypothetical protein
VTKSPNKDKPTTKRITLSFLEIPGTEGITTVAELTDCRTAGTLIVGIGIGKVDFHLAVMDAKLPRSFQRQNQA